MWINLGLQFLILGLIILALIAWRNKRLARHGTIMSVALLLGLASALLVMIPVFYDSFGDFINDVQMGSLRAQINLVHGAVGIIAIGFTTYVCGRYAYGKFKVGRSCYSKNLMRGAIGVWLVAISMGVLVFLAQALKWD